MSRTAVLIPWALAALLAGALGAVLMQRQATPAPAAVTITPAPAPAASVPWYCTSPDALAAFQKEYPTLGVVCP